MSIVPFCKETASILPKTGSFRTPKKPKIDVLSEYYELFRVDSIRLRIPADRDRPFRFIVTTDSGGT